MKEKKYEELIIEVEENDFDNKSFILKKDKNTAELFIKDEFYEDIIAKSFHNFKIMKSSAELNLKIYEGISIVGEIKAINAILNFLNNENGSLWEALLFFNEEFEIKKEEVIKFRGDIAEAIFLYKKGGEKIVDGASVDVKVDNRFAEIKSFSPQKKSVMISSLQIEEDTDKYAVEIRVSNDGKSILEISELIFGNEVFKKYLSEKYKDSIFNKIKYKITEPIYFNDILPQIKNDPYVLSAKYIISIASKISNQDSNENNSK